MTLPIVLFYAGAYMASYFVSFIGVQALEKSLHIPLPLDVRITADALRFGHRRQRLRAQPPREPIHHLEFRHFFSKGLQNPHDS